MTCLESPLGCTCEEEVASYVYTGDDDEAYTELSDREMEVMRLLVTGATEKCIGCRLGIKRHTVRSHIVHSSRKLRVSGKPMLIAFVISYGIVPIEEVRANLYAHTGVLFCPQSERSAAHDVRQTDDCVLSK